MLPHLIRPRFLDLIWGVGELEAAAEFWLELYEKAARAHRFSPSPFHELEVRFRGFPRNDGAAIRDALCARLERANFPAPRVELHDPNTLVFASGSHRGSELPPAGLGISLLDGVSFDGLMVEIRFEVVGNDLRFLGGTVRSTLVLVGELRSGGLLLKSAWRTGTSGWEDDLFWKTRWPEEDRWLEALAAFRSSRSVPADLAKVVHQPRGIDRTAGVIVRMTYISRGKPRLVRLLIRGFIYAALLAVLGFLAFYLIDHEQWAALVLVALPIYIVLSLATQFVRSELKGLFSSYARLSKNYKAAAEAGSKQVLVSFPNREVEAALDQPWNRKYSAELEAAGFVHAGVVRVEPPTSGKGLTRIFLAPDRVTYLKVLFMTSTRGDSTDGLQIWPATSTCIAHTYFSGGGRVSSVNGRSVGYRRKLTGPERRYRLFPDIENPVELFVRHARVVEEYQKETGQTPILHERLDMYLRRLAADQDEAHRLRLEHPYTWREHLRFYLQIQRQEFLG